MNKTKAVFTGLSCMFAMNYSGANIKFIRPEKSVFEEVSETQESDDDRKNGIINKVKDLKRRIKTLTKEEKRELKRLRKQLE